MARTITHRSTCNHERFAESDDCLDGLVEWASSVPHLSDKVSDVVFDGHSSKHWDKLLFAWSLTDDYDAALIQFLDDEAAS